MLDPELLALLVCPETRQDVRLATTSELSAMNGAIRLHTLQTVGGVPVTEAVEGALIRVDLAVAYPIRDGIPVMLVPEALAVAALNLNSETVVHG